MGCDYLRNWSLGGSTSSLKIIYTRQNYFSILDSPAQKVLWIDSVLECKQSICQSLLWDHFK